MDLWNAIARDIEAATGVRARVDARRAVGGGCINEASVVPADDGDLFVKLNRADGLEMFEAEAQGLAELAAAGALRVPRPVCWGAAAGRAWLVMEHLDLGGRGADEALGRGLAALHRCTAERFGWHRDNTIGATPQINTPDHDWVRFWRDRRLGYQLELAERNGFGGALARDGERLCEALPELLRGHEPAPSLLHGDLWGGNHAVTVDGEPAIFDPAVYYGDRETDLAMTELFGGFGRGFYRAYNEAWPLAPGYERRKVLYNLYHVLNHLNLFGGGYLSQAQSMLRRLLSEAG